MHGAGQRAQARWDVCSCHFLIPAKFCYLGFSCYIRERMAAGGGGGGSWWLKVCILSQHWGGWDWRITSSRSAWSTHGSIVSNEIDKNRLRFLSLWALAFLYLTASGLPADPAWNAVLKVAHLAGTSCCVSDTHWSDRSMLTTQLLCLSGTLIWLRFVFSPETHCLPGP